MPLTGAANVYIQSTTNIQKILEFSKVAEHKIDIQKLTVPLCSSSRKCNVKDISTAKSKVHGINLTEDVQNLYEVKYKALLKDIKERDK